MAEPMPVARSTRRANAAFYPSSESTYTPEQIVSFLKGQLEKKPLTDYGKTEFEKFKIALKDDTSTDNTDNIHLVTQEVFGFLDCWDEEDIDLSLLVKLFDPKRWLRSYNLWKGQIVADSIAHFKAVLEELAKENDLRGLTDEWLKQVSIREKHHLRSVVEDEGGFKMESQQHALSMSDSAADSTSSAGLSNGLIKGSGLHHLMFQSGRNKMITGRFMFPGYEDRQTNSMKLEDFLTALGLDRSEAKKLEPHINRLSRARVLLKCVTRDGKVDVDAEPLTQAIFNFVLDELIASFYAEELQVVDVSGMECAVSPIELSKEWLSSRKKQKVVHDSYSLTLRSDLVICQKQIAHEGLSGRDKLDLFIDCKVNIEMKTYKKCKNLKRVGKTQLNGESWMRSVKRKPGKDRRGVLYSVLCDSNGLLVLIHEAVNKNSDETGSENAQGDNGTKIPLTAGDRYFQSRWECGSARMIAILRWAIKSEKDGKDFASTGFKLLEETSKDSTRSLPSVDENDVVEDAEENGEDAKHIMEADSGGGRQGNEKKRLVLDLNKLCDDDSDSQEQQGAPLLFSYGLSKAFYGREVPLEKEVLKATIDSNRVKRRKFCLSTGNWYDGDDTCDTGVQGLTQSSGSLFSDSSIES